ncbi:hypothetical protein FB45DRAFT_1032953 [Roridomyces roridus]|uniref:Novel STAND NTPase 1 domain-containing protein n=1 Tax=Roridomyces roridus TaxID=1738132 RepID=A0AAD7FF52_9AGAR|nr:hypothetical protein FB45DRAFT_1032953 [Roridomyces roridus]
MSPAPGKEKTRVDDLADCLSTAASLLQNLYDAFGTPFLVAIANTVPSLISGIQGAKRNKEQCNELAECCYGIILAIVKVHIDSETPRSLSPVVLHHIAAFTTTIHKIHNYVNAQLHSSRIKSLFRQSEMVTLLGQCRVAVKDAQVAFKVASGASFTQNLGVLEQQMQSLHEQILQLIASLPDETISERSSVMYASETNYRDSSNSFSLLPSYPKIFHGRDWEVVQIVSGLSQDSGRVVILGAGGMGKTSLARAAVHHPVLAAKYSFCAFVPCDSVTGTINLAALIGSYIGLTPKRDLTQPVVQFFASRQAASLLVLDNFETPWEPKDSRSSVEDFLSLLSAIPNLGLLVTMRGAERPSRVQWTRPFMQPLAPLSNAAARQTFIDIADDVHVIEDMDKILGFTDNMPLAVDLAAHLVANEGCERVLARWETEKTAMLSEGLDRRSNLDVSIGISLSSARIQALPGARDLLSLLSILPDGLSPVELVQLSLTIPHLLECKSALLAASLAYMDDRNWLKELVLIREHVQRYYSVSPSIVRPLRTHFSLLLEVYRSLGYQNGSAVKQITANLANIRSVLLQGLQIDHPDVVDSIQCTVSLSNFGMHSARGRESLMDRVAPLLDRLGNHALSAEYISEEFASTLSQPVSDPAPLIAAAQIHFSHINNPVLESLFYTRLGYYCLCSTGEKQKGLQYLKRAEALSRLNGDPKQRALVLSNLADINCKLGDPAGGLIKAREARRLAQLAGSPYVEARTLRTQGRCTSSLADYKTSLDLVRQARELLGLCGMTDGLLENLIASLETEVHFFKSEYLEGQQANQRILDRTSPTRDLFPYAFASCRVLRNNLETGVLDGMAGALADTIAMFESIAHLPGLTLCKVLSGEYSLIQGDWSAAKMKLVEALHTAWGTSEEDSAPCLESLSDVRRWGPEDRGWSRRYAVVYLAHGMRSQRRSDLHKALRRLGDIFLLDEDEQTAMSLFCVALEGFTQMDVHRSRAECLLRIGDLVHRSEKLLPLDEMRRCVQAEDVTAKSLWGEARALFQRSLQEKSVVEIDARLSRTSNYNRAQA